LAVVEYGYLPQIKGKKNGYHYFTHKLIALPILPITPHYGDLQL